MEDKEPKILTMDEEMVAHRNNDKGDLVLLLDGWKSIGCKWMLKQKISLDGNARKYKAKLVAKEYSQVEGIKFGSIQGKN